MDPDHMPIVPCQTKQSTQTRSSTYVWLVGQQLNVLDGASCSDRLPTTRHVLRCLFYDLKTNKLTLSASCSNVINEVFVLWHAANIPTIQKPNAVAKLKALYGKHEGLARNKSRRTDRQAQLEQDFSSLLKNLFDIAHADCQKMIKIKEDWIFLQDQRVDRKMAMGEEDIEFKAREERKRQRKEHEFFRKEKASKTADMFASTVMLTDSDQDDDNEPTFLLDNSELKTDDKVDSADTNDEPQISNYHRKRLNIGQTDTHQAPSASASSAAETSSLVTPRKRCLVDDALFVASLDRTRTTPREAMHIITPALKAVGIAVDDITLSSSSIYRARKTVRVSLADDQKQLFKPNTPLVAHFDGKRLPDNDGGLVDRMPIVISGLHVEKLLSIAKLPISTGQIMGDAVVQALRDWKDVPEWLCGLCFDTTSSNTGIHTGAITVIQRAFDKRLLFLACRHHILEIVSTAVFDLFFKSSGQQIAVFGRFKEQWNFIDITKYSVIDESVTPGSKSCLTDAEKQWLHQNRANVVSFLVMLLGSKTQPRQDYLELIKLSLILLGESDVVAVNGLVHFSPPGAYHRARWMAKGIYCLKMFLFREQFKLTAAEQQALRRICLFTVTIYIKAWFTAPNTCDAPLNDLCLLQTLELFEAVDSQVADAVMKKMRGHLWYLSKDLIGLALFSDSVYRSEKMCIVAALNKPTNQPDVRRVDPKAVRSFHEMTLSHFATERTTNLLTALRIDRSCLDGDPSTWSDCPTYVKAKEIVCACCQ